MLSKGEELLLTILDTQFPHYTILPQKAVKVGYKTLYLDYYIPQLKKAFEFDGEAHFSFIKHFHKTISGFLKSKGRDTQKDKYCKDNGITLIRISHNEALSLETLRQKLSILPIYES